MTPELGHIQLIDTGIVPMDVALDRAFEHCGIEKLGGASGKGWSRYNAFQQCPRKYYLKNIVKERGEEPKPLAVGSAFHAFMALYYFNMRRLLDDRPEVAAPSELRDFLLDSGAKVEYVQEGWRLFDAYADYYEGRDDPWIPRAVEHLVVDPATGNSCRYDVIWEMPEDRAAAHKLKAGIYIGEHKSASNLGISNREGWHLDGEVVGQIHLWERAGLHELFGPLEGVVVNIVTKTKVPQFHREVVAPFRNLVAGQARALDYWDAQMRMCQSTGYWPKALASCRNRYGLCEYFQICQETT